MLLSSALLTAATLAGPAPAPQDEEPAAERSPELLDHDALTARLAGLEADELVTLIPIGTSRGGRSLQVVRISRGDPAPGKPAILVVANIDGPQVFSSAVALWQVETLLAEHAEDPQLQAFLELTTLYVLPRANPDAAEARFATPLAEVERGGHGVDEDRDGRSGENGRSDVDGDGRITHMRVPDPEGDWIEDPTDARALVEADAKKGQRGRWKLVPEGRDTDGDEDVAEDPEHDTLLNRNFPQDWVEHDPESGLFPMDEPEARAIADFLIRHPDVALVVTYGWQDNLVEKPKSVKAGAPSIKRRPAPGVIQPDADALAELGRRYAEITGNKTQGRKSDGGSFQSWVYQHRGLHSLAIRLWDLPLDSKGPAAEEPEGEEAGDESSEGESPTPERKQDEAKPGDDAKRLKWIDAEDEGWRFSAWKPFDHPELGPVEIGGFTPYARIEPPDSEAGELARKQLDFLVSLGEALPRVELVDCTARVLADGLLEVEVALENDALLPLQSASAQRTRTVRPARLQLVLPDGASVVAGSERHLVRSLEGAGGRREFRWLVSGAPPDAVGVGVDTDNAGTARIRAEVKQ